MKYSKTYLLILIVLLKVSIVKTQFKEYNYKRKINTTNKNWQKIELPNNIFSKLNTNFSDLRILKISNKNDTVEIPYLLTSTYNNIVTEKRKLNIINESSKKNNHYFTLDNVGLVSTNQIVIDFIKQNYIVDVQLKGSNDLVDWFTILENIKLVAVKNKKTNFKQNTIDFPVSKYKYYQITIKSKEKPLFNSVYLVLEKINKGYLKKIEIKNILKKENKKLNQSEISINLKEYTPISFLNIKVNHPSNFYRPISIKYLIDSIKTEKGWVNRFNEVKTNYISSKLPNKFNFNSIFTKTIKLTITNHNNIPLQISEIEVKGGLYNMYVQLNSSSKNYFLFYGNNTAEKPKYDINNFKEIIPEVSSNSKLGFEQNTLTNKTIITEPLFKNKFWLWGIIILVITTLGYFSLKMLK